MLSQLPIEMLEEVINWLPVKDLLHSARGVNSTWKSIATSICRQRHVAIKSPVYRLGTSEDGDTKQLEELCSTFQVMNELPWSACTLQIINDETGGSTEKLYRIGSINMTPDHSNLQRFLQVFGSHILKFSARIIESVNLSVDVAYYDHNLISILEGMPNLEVLILDLWIGYFRAEEYKRIQFRRLRHLDIGLSFLSYVDIMELLMELNSLQSIKISLDMDEMDLLLDQEKLVVPRFAKLIAPIPFISMCVQHVVGWADLKFLKTPTMEWVFLHELEIQISSYNEEEGNVFVYCLEQLLNHSAKCLQKLVLVDRSRLNGFSHGYPRLQIPSLPNLKHLALKSNNRFGFLNGNVFTNLVPFTSEQFPLLETFDARMINGGFYSVLNSAQFGSVTRLVISDSKYASPNANIMVTDWNRICPNVREMYAGWVNQESFQYIFSEMKSLELLELEVRSTTWLAGILDFEDPSHLSLTRLRTFKLKLTLDDGTDVDEANCRLIFGQLLPHLKDESISVVY